jgi:2-polyprenyl-6-methoxyphenol hydroxylase-like FAD-dependent oxidoreductase
MKAVVVGGGIGGVATAVALGRQGIDVELCERAPELRDIGAGKSVWVNGIEALRHLGVDEEVLSLGSPLESLVITTWRGRVLQRIPVGRLGRSVAVTRRDVFDPLVKHLNGTVVRTNARCVGVSDEGDHVTARFDNGERAEGDFLIGADGIFSSVRAQLFGGWVPQYAGHVAWRGIASFEHSDWPVGTAVNYYGRGRHFAVEPLQGGRMFWYGTKNMPQEAKGRGKEEVSEAFGDSIDPIPALIEATSPEWIVRNRLFNLPFRPTWGKGRITLLGDAAHAMLPNLGQGACTAIEDAVVLAKSLATTSDIQNALRSYERARRRRVRWIHWNSAMTSRLQLLENRIAACLRDAWIWSQPGPLINQIVFRPILRFHP